MTEVCHRKAPPPHGDRRRYHYWKCRCDDCREAARLYDKRRREGRAQSRFVDPTGSTRRIRGLVAIGYTFPDMAAELGTRPEWPAQLAYGRHGSRGMLRVTAERVAEMCDRLARRNPPTGRNAVYARTVAKRNGWVPLHAWDDLDDPAEQPNLGSDCKIGVDEVAVERALRGGVPFRRLTDDEKVVLFRDHLAGWTYSPTMALLGVSASTVKTWRERAAESRQVAA